MVIITAVTMTSCGGAGGSAPDLKDGQSAAKSAIALAEQACPVQDCAVLGRLPAICMQQKVAADSVHAWYKALRSELQDKAKDEDSFKKAVEEAEVYEAAEKAAEEAIREHYMPLKEQEAQKLAGMDVPVVFDPAQYAAATVKVLKVTPEKDGANVKFEATLTPLVSLGSGRAYVEWCWDLAGGEKTKEGAMPLPSIPKVGEPFTTDGITEATPRTLVDATALHLLVR